MYTMLPGAVPRSAGPMSPQQMQMQCPLSTGSSISSKDGSLDSLSSSGQQGGPGRGRTLMQIDAKIVDSGGDGPPPPPAYDVVFASRKTGAEEAKDTLRVTSTSSGSPEGAREAQERRLPPFKAQHDQQGEEDAGMDEKDVATDAPPVGAIHVSGRASNNMLASDRVQAKLAAYGHGQQQYGQSGPAETIRYSRLRRLSHKDSSDDADTVTSSTSTYQVTADENVTSCGYASNVILRDDSSPDAAKAAVDYKQMEQDLARALPDADVRQVVLKCLSAYCVVFQDTIMPVDENDDNIMITQQPLAYSRMDDVPAGAAKMLWAALIGDSLDDKTTDKADFVKDELVAAGVLQENNDTQCLQIQRDLQYQYGIFLSSRKAEEGGFAAAQGADILDDLTDGNETTVAAVEREHGTMKTWNKLMADECLKNLKNDEPYTLHMLPAHLLRTGRNKETSDLLCDVNFFSSRVKVMGAQRAAIVQTQDVEELERRIYMALDNSYAELDDDEVEIDAEDIIIDCCEMMVTYLTKKYAPTKDDRGGETGRALNSIASFLGRKDFTDEALSYYKEAFAFKKAALGPDHESVARTLHSMGNLHMERSQFEDAIRCYSDALTIERTKNDNKSNIATTLNSLGMIYGMTSQYDEAIKCYEEANVVEKDLYGNTDLKCAESLNNLGIIHGIKGDYQSAIKCYSETLDIKRSQLGYTHSEVADSLFTMGIIYTKMGDFASAVDCYQSSLCVRKEIFGEDHEEVARVLHCLGIVFCDMGEVENSVRCYEESLRIRLLRLGDDHEDVARTLNKLGEVYFQSQDYHRALECFEGALRVSKKKRRRDNKQIGDTLNSMGEVCSKLRILNRARDIFLEALKVRRRMLGDEHVDTATSLHNLGDVYYMMNQYDQAMQCYNAACRIRYLKLGQDDVDLAATRNNMGVIHLKRGENDEAMECFSEALRVRQLKFGGANEKVGDTLHNMGLVHKNLKQYEQAVLRYSEALKLRRAKNGDGCLKVADTLYNMGIVYSNSNNHALALARYKDALQTYRDAGLPEGHTCIANTMTWINWAEKKLRD